MNEFLTLLKPELAITVIIFLLLFIKIGKGMSNDRLLVWIQIFLFLNFVVGFVANEEGSMFGGLYYTNGLIALQKNILNLGVSLISLLFADWFKKGHHTA